MIRIFIGDVGEYLSVEARKYDPSAVLITTENLHQISEGVDKTYFTSLADVGSLENFLNILLQADEIVYSPPARWSDHKSGNKQQQWTEHVLRFVGQTIKVTGADYSSKEIGFLKKDYVNDVRKTSDQQMWAVGCSVTFGEGVELESTWKYLVSQRLNLLYSDLSACSSSIVWQSDQICQADIKKDDLVFWGITNQPRMPIIDDRTFSLVHLNNSRYDKDPYYLKNFPPDLLDNNTLRWHNVMAVRRASNFCRKIGAKLVILGLLFDNDLNRESWTCYNVKEFYQTVSWPMKYADMGTDNLHPGPKQHAIFADQFIKFYNQLYQ